MKFELQKVDKVLFIQKEEQIFLLEYAFLKYNGSLKGEEHHSLAGLKLNAKALSN